MSALFCGTGVALPFMATWLQAERGLTGAQIGVVLSSASLLRLGIGPWIGAWADGLADRRAALRLLSTGATLGYAVFFSVHGFVPLLVTGFVAVTMSQALSPLLESATLRSSVGGPIPFGVARALGSAAFIVGNVLGGALAARYGFWIAAWWVVAALALTSALTWGALPPDPTDSRLDFQGRLAAVAKLLRSPRFAAVLAAAGAAQAAHAFYYNFSALVWRAQGIGADTVGALWAFGVIVEIGFLAVLPRIERRVRPEGLLFAGALGGAVRWALLALAPGLPWLWPLQTLHAASFAAAHVGALRIVQRDAPGAVAGAAQTLYAALASGTFIGLATLASGVLYEGYGAGGYWLMAAMAGAATALLAAVVTDRIPA